MNVNDLYPSKWIKSDDLSEGDLHLTITDLTMQVLGMEDEEQPVLWFDESERGLPLNKTNANAIAQLHGPEIEQWTGKRISLYRTEVEFQGKTVWGVRVRLTAPDALAAATEAVEQGPPEPVPPGSDVPF